MRPLTPPPACTLLTRRRAQVLGGVTIPAVVLASVLSANPALAVTTDKSSVTSAFGNASSTATTFELGADLTGDAGTADVQTLADGADLTIDLHGNDLDLDRIVLGRNAHLTVKDSAAAADRGTLSIGGASLDQDDELSGVKLNQGAHLTIDHANLTTKGSGTHAGIGTAGSTTGTEVALDHATVTAESEAGAGIRAAEVDVVASDVSVKPGIDASTTTLDRDSTLRIPTGAMTLGTGQVLTNEGTIRGGLTGSGTVHNEGTILPGPAGVSAGLTVDGNDYLVGFDPNGLAGGPTSPQRVYAKDLATAGITDITTPALTSDDKNFVRWEVGGHAFTTGTELDTIAVTGSNGRTVSVVAKTSQKVRVSAGSLGDGVETQAYTGSVAAIAGEDITKYEANGLPAGLEIDEHTGALSGIPAEHGQFTVEVTITSQYDGVKTKDYPLTVGTLPTLSTAALADGVIGSSYAPRITATDSSPSTVMHFTKTAGTLPAGLALQDDGTFAGSPTTKGSFTFTVKAQGTWGSSEREYTIVTHSAPVFTTAGLVAPAGNQYSGKVVATNAAGDGAIIYTISSRGTLPAGFTLDEDGTLHGAASRVGEYSFTVLAHNQWKDVTKVVTLAVGNVPDFTTAASLPRASKGVDYSAAGHPVSIAATGEGVAYDAVDLPNGLSLDRATGVISGAPTSTLDGGSATFTVTASNRFGQVDKDYTLRIGTAPAITGPSALLDGSTARDYSATVASTGTGTRTLSVLGLPDGMTFDAATGAIAGRPTATGTYPVVITATSDWGTATRNLSLHVGTAPTALAGSLPVAVAGGTYDQPVSATGADSFSATGLPAWLAIDETTGRLTSTSVPSTSGTATFDVTAHNDYGDTSKTYTIKFGVAATLSHTAPRTAVLGKSFSFTPTAGGDVTSITTTALPAGLVLTNGVISGTPTAAGSTTVTVTAHSEFGDARYAYAIVVKQPVSIVTADLQPVALVQDGADFEGAVEQQIELAGEGDHLALQLVDGPSWLELHGSTLIGTATEPGTYTVKVKATSDLTDDVAVKTLHLLVGKKPAVVESVLASGTVGEAYTAHLQVVEDADTPQTDTTWTISGLPAGMEASADGTISGTPTVSGTSTVIAVAHSAFGASAPQALTLKVAAKAVAPEPVKTVAPEPAKTVAPEPVKTVAPTTTPSAPTPVQSSTPVAAPATAPALPAVPAVTAKYGHPLALAVVADSKTVVTYSVVGGALPKGVELNGTTGVISGSPAEEGIFKATVKATNAGGSTTAVVTIAVPKVVELVQAAPQASTQTSGKPVEVTVKGLKKGEAWTIKVDGKTKLRGTARTSGNLVVSVPLPKSLRDKTHTIRVGGHKSVTDPAKRDWTTFQVTSVAARKSLTVKRSGSTVTVTRLAAKETVTITEGGRMIASGRANAEGIFSFSMKKLAKGKHTLTATGATAKRTGSVSVKIG